MMSPASVRTFTRYKEDMPHQRNTTPQRYRPPASIRHQQRVVEGGVREQTWPGTLMVLGIFVGVISFWWVGSKTFITYTGLGRWFALFAFAGNLLSYSRAGLRLGMERLEWFLFNLLAVGPFLFSLALWVNLEIHGPERRYIIHMNGVAYDVRRYWLATGELPPNTPVDPSVRGTADDPLEKAPIGAHLLGTARGVLGYEVISTWEKIGEREE